MLAQFAGPLACVVGLSIGQVLFKLAARRLNETQSFFDMSFLLTLGSALMLYAAMSGVWVLILQRIDLSKAYPIMALSFVFVPAMAWLIFREPIPLSYILGCAMIIGGIVFIGLNSA